METVFAPPLERRREEWFKELADVTTELQQKVEGLTAENLSKNELFISVAAQATQIAHSAPIARRNSKLFVTLSSEPDCRMAPTNKYK